MATRRSLAGVVLLVAAAYSGDSDRPAEQTSTTTAPSSTTTTSPSTSTSIPTYTLVSVEGGDAACYLGVTNAAGAQQTFPADFELCPGGTSDATGKIGKRVALETRPSQVIADSCAGDPNCKETKTVDLVVAVTVR